VQEQQQDGGEQGATERRASRSLYTRPMPGGGCVRVELVVSESGNASAGRLRGRVVLERRAVTRAVPPEEPLIVEELEGDDVNAVVAELFRIARDNAAIARRMLKQQQRQARAD
jgi:hypothetical protein